MSLYRMWEGYILNVTSVRIIYPNHFPLICASRKPPYDVKSLGWGRMFARKSYGFYPLIIIKPITADKSFVRFKNYVRRFSYES
jgi:hypothetical protein